MAKKNMTHYVQISNEKNSFFLPTKNNIISAKTIKTYFPEASGLTYEFDSEIRCVNLVNDNFELIHYIDEYKVFYANLNKVNPAKHDNVIMEIIEKHKLKSNSIKKKKRMNDGPKTKEVVVGWKHKSSHQDTYKLMTEPVGGSKKLTLDLEKEYTYEDIKSLCIQSMKNDDNENFFKNSIIELGNFQNTIFINFATEDDQECDNFWEFAYNIRTRNGQLRLYLLTSKKFNSLESQQSPKAEKISQRFVATSTSTSVSPIPTVSATLDPKILSNLSNKSEDCKSVADTQVCAETDRKCKKRKLNSGILNNSGEQCNVKPIENSEAVKENMDQRTLSSSSSTLTEIKNSVKLITKDEIQFSNKLIGQGGYGSVQKARWCHTTVAVKTIRRGFNEKYIHREIAVMSKIRHPNLISIMAVCLDTTHCYLVMEYFLSANLRNVLFDESNKTKYALVEHDRKFIAEQMCTAISYLHDPINSIVHEDIKPENILINTDLHVKICDMGLSKASDLSASLNTTIGNDYKGTPMYMAPELLLREKSATIYSDIWALACVIKELFCEKPIWPVFSIQDLKALVLSKSIPDLNEIADPSLNKLLLDCFSYTPENRPQCVKLLEFFQRSQDYSSSSDSEDYEVPEHSLK